MIYRISRLCTKSPKVKHFSLRPLRISALELLLTAENAEVRRGPQRKTAFRRVDFLCKAGFLRISRIKSCNLVM